MEIPNTREEAIRYLEKELAVLEQQLAEADSQRIQAECHYRTLKGKKYGYESMLALIKKGNEGVSVDWRKVWCVVKEN